MEVSRLARIASTLSSMVMYSLAWTISMGRRAAARWRPSSGLEMSPDQPAARARRIGARHESRPRFRVLGARSEPIASSAITLGMVLGRLAGFFDVENFASLIVPALGTGAVRHLLLVAVRALGKAVGLESIVGAPGGSALLGVSAFWIRHGIEFLFGAEGPAAQS